MQVGNRSKLALELAIGDKYDNSQLFMYVAGCKFGDEDDLYDYRRVVRNVINSYRKSNLTLDYLYDCPGEIVIDAVRMYAKWNFEYLREDIDQPQEDFDHKILASYPQFLDIADDLDTCVFRFVPYAFDNSLVLTIPFKNSLRICISEDVSERYAETSTTFEEFYGLWGQLSSRIEEEHPII